MYILISIFCLLSGFCFVFFYVIPSTEKRNRGRLARFKHSKKYIFHGYGIIDSVYVLSCSKGSGLKTFFFERPSGVDAKKLTPGIIYIFYKPTIQNSGILLTESEYNEVNSNS
jgi:hypothetical protein